MDFEEIDQKELTQSQKRCIAEFQYNIRRFERGTINYYSRAVTIFLKISGIEEFNMRLSYMDLKPFLNRQIDYYYFKKIRQATMSNHFHGLSRFFSFLMDNG